MIAADLTRPDRNEQRQHFKGADAVIAGTIRGTRRTPRA